MVEGRRHARQPEVQHARRVPHRGARLVPAPVIGQRSTGKETHRHERAALVVAGVGDRHDRLVQHRPHRLDFTDEAGHHLPVPPHLPLRHLDDHRHAGLRIPGPVGDPHAARTELRDEPVTVADHPACGGRRVEPAGRGGHPSHERIGGGVPGRRTGCGLAVAEAKQFRDPGQFAGRVGGLGAGAVRRLPWRIGCHIGCHAALIREGICFT